MILDSKLEKFIFYNVPVFLFSSLPFFLITGPFLSDLSISLISLLFLIYCIKKQNFSYFRNKYFYFFLVFWLYLIFNTLINNFNLDSFKISFLYFRYGVFAIALATLLNFDYKFLKYFFYCILICFFVLIIDGFYQYFSGENLLGVKIHKNFRVSSFFGDELILGSYLSRLWPILFGLSLFFVDKKTKIFLFVVLIFILSEVLIFLSGERASFFFINLSSLFIILFSKKLIKFRIVILLCSLMVIIFISFLNPGAKERIIDKTINQMILEKSEKEEKIHIFSKAHTQHYITAYKMFMDNKLFGVGVKNFRNFCDDKKYNDGYYSCSTHPHNTYIQILAETGIFGFLFLIFVLFYFCKHLLFHAYHKFKKNSYFNDFEICILSGIAIYLWPFVPTGSVFNNWLNIILFLYFSLLLWERKPVLNYFKK